MNNSSILIIEDELAIAETLRYALEREGFVVIHTVRGALGLSALEKHRVDLVILDIGLPDISGFDVCKKIRAISEIPVLFLTARNDEIDRIVGLEIGGDDYVAKPFSPREVVARVRVILKRTKVISHSDSPCAETREFIVDDERARISYRNNELHLTKYEYLLLKTLLQHPERVFSREQLMDLIWSEPLSSLDRAVDNHIKTLRAKLREVADIEVIVTHRGLGYSAKRL